jgi:hypothetical protein
MVGVLLLEGVGQLDDVSGKPPLAGLQHPAVGVGEAGEIEVRQFVQRVFGLDKAGLQLAGGGAQRGHGRLAGSGDGAAGIAHEGLARRGVRRHAPGREQRLGLAGVQPVAHDRLGEPLLLAAGHARQGGGGGGREAAVIEMRDHLGGEPPAEGQAPLHPGAPAPRGLGDLRGGQAIVVREGADDARLVHRAHGAPGRVGLEQSDLADDTVEGVLFHDHGDVGVPLAAPAGQPLEPIEDLIGAVPGRRHPQGQRGQRDAGIRARAPEGRERGGQPLDRDVQHQAHGRSSDSDKIW